MYLGSGLLLAILSIPLIFHKIKPNGLYGFRVKRTLEDPNLWYAVNEYAGKWLLVTGICTILVSVILYFIPGISVDGYALRCLGVFVVVIAIGMIRSVRYMRRFD